MNNADILETPRLRLRFLSQDDFDFFFRMQSDPELMRYIRPPETDAGVIRERIDTLMKYGRENPGLGSLIVEWKATGQPAAMAVLRHVDYKPENELELGYVIAQEFQGKGLATEITRALAAWAFDRFSAPLVVAVTDPENLASQKVLLKCGFRLKGKRFIYGGECLEYELRSPAFDAAAPPGQSNPAL